MALIALKCPNCNGDVVLEDTLTRGFCMFCGTKILNESAMPSKTQLDRSEELTNLIELGRVSMMMYDYDKAVQCADKALEINPNCPDAWYLKGISLDKQSYFNKGNELSSGINPLFYDWRTLQEKKLSCSFIPTELDPIINNYVAKISDTSKNYDHSFLKTVWNESLELYKDAYVDKGNAVNCKNNYRNYLEHTKKKSTACHILVKKGHMMPLSQFAIESWNLLSRAPCFQNC